jgi:hypothetical protein
VLKMSLTGDWGLAKSILSKSAQLKRSINDAVLQEANQARRDIIKGITEQAPAGKQFDPLSPMTLALRRARGFRGKKILLVTAGLRNSVTVKRMGNGAVYVGVLRSAKSKDGKMLYNIARIQEMGGVIVIRVTPRMRKWLMIQLRKVGYATREKGDQKRDSGGRFKKKKFVASGMGQMSQGVIIIKIPARPFIAPVIEKILSDPKGLQMRMAHRVAKGMNMALGKPT